MLRANSTWSLKALQHSLQGLVAGESEKYVANWATMKALLGGRLGEK